MHFEHLNILLIEDDSDIRKIVSQFLALNEELNFDLAEADIMSQGLELLKEQRFDVIILDLNLPDSLGLDSLAKVRAAEPDTPLVVLTGLTDTETVSNVLKMGADEYIDKSHLSNQLLVRTLYFAIERRKAAERIEHEKAQKELILDSLFERVIMVDNKKNVLWANRSARALTNSKLDDFIGRPCQEYLGRDDSYCDQCVLTSVLKSGEHATAEVNSPNGRVFHTAGTPVYDSNGEIIGAVEVSLDVTQLKKAEKNLQSSRLRYEQLVQNAVDIIYHIDINGFFTFINSAVEKVLGYRPEELTGTNAWDLKGGEKYLEALDQNRRSFADGETSVYLEFPITTKNGGEVWLGQNLWRVENSDGTVGYQAIARDITELKKTSDELEDAYLHIEERIRLRTAELEEAKLQWERTFDAVPDRLAIIDTEYRLLRVNKAMADSMGKNKSDVIGHSCRELAECAHQALEACPHSMMMKDRQPHTVETYDDRNKVTLSVSAAPLYDNDGQLLGCVHVSRDISDTKNAERLLQEQLNFQQKLLDTIPNPVFYKDSDGLYTGCNHAFARFLGVSRHDIVGKTIYEVWDKQLADVFHEQDANLLASRGTRQFEEQIPDAQGNKREVILNKAVYHGADDEPAGLVGIIVDITELRKAERELSSSEERYRNLVETLSEGLIIVNPELSMVFANRRFREMVEIQDNENIAELNLFDFLDQKNQQIVITQYERRRAGADDTYEVTFTSRSGNMVNTLISPKPIFNRDKEFRGSLALVTDITERKKLESQLGQAQKLESIGQLAAGIAHEINTPTQFVLSNTRFLEESFGDLSRLLDSYAELAKAAEKDDHMAGMARAVRELAEEVDLEFLAEEIPKAIAADVDGLERIAKIVSSMKAFSHPGEDDFSLTNLNTALENTLTVARNEYKYVADVELNLAPNLPPVPCLAAELNQVFLNIIVNAAQAIGEVVKEGDTARGRIVISSAFDEENVTIKIRDDGPGVPQEIQSRLFDPFFTTKEPGKGTGQGLAIAYRVVVEQHHGNIWLTSEPGDGTEFVIRIPLARDGGGK